MGKDSGVLEGRWKFKWSKLLVVLSVASAVVCDEMGKTKSIIADAGAMGISGHGHGHGHGGEGDESQGPLLHRAKRYSNFPRGPLAFMNKVTETQRQPQEEGPNDNFQDLNQNFYTKRYLLGRDSEAYPTSHFRELSPPSQPRFGDSQQLASNDQEFDGDSLLTSYPIMARRSSRRYAQEEPAEDLPSQLAPLSDEELQTILLLLDGYALSSKGGNPAQAQSQSQIQRTLHKAMKSAGNKNYNPNPNYNMNEVIAEQLLEQQQQEQQPNMPAYYNPNYLTPDELRRVARMYAMGKRENDEPSPRQQQQLRRQALASSSPQGRFLDLDLDLQQEHSPGYFEQPNSHKSHQSSDRLEFLTPKRSKRVGGGIPVTNPELANPHQGHNSRIKKETGTENKSSKPAGNIGTGANSGGEDDNDNENENLSDDEGETEPPRALPLTALAPASLQSQAQGQGATTDKALTIVSTTTTTGSGTGQSHSKNHPTHAATGQIPAPSQAHGESQASSGNMKAKNKKSIDWSQYFGIDKKSGHPPQRHHQNPQVKSTQEGEKESAPSGSPSAAPGTYVDHAGDKEKPKVESALAEGVARPQKSKAIVAARITEPNKTVMKESKDHKKLRMREENETENKSDRKWILNEFYKNMAMSTNVRKRKRDVSADETDELAALEEKMKVAGDDIIWDALKYTGAHKDEPLSPLELAQVKKDIIQKLATAYNLEKIREAIDTFREQLIAIKTNNV